MYEPDIVTDAFRVKLGLWKPKQSRIQLSVREIADREEERKEIHPVWPHGEEEHIKPILLFMNENIKL